MNRVVLGLVMILALSMLGQILKRACDMAGVPFLTITILRDTLLVGLFFRTFGSVHLLEARRLGSVLLLFLILFSFYLFASALEDRLGVGLYYLRIYLLPILFFVAAHIEMQGLDRTSMDGLLRVFLWLNAFMLMLAFGIHIFMQLFPAKRALMFGTDFIPFAWFVSGAGGTLMRMGLPMSGPNNLGIYLGLMALVLLFLLLWRGERQKASPALMLLAGVDLIGLVGTFSRSSILMVLVAFLSLVFIPAFRRNGTLFRVFVAGFVLVTLFLCGLLIIEAVNNGFASRWLELNFKFQDPSIRGHWQSLKDAYDNLEQYYLYGYPRGTVGPKAMMFRVSQRFNVENSLLSLLYDFGIIGATSFIAAYGLLLRVGYRSSYQLSILFGFLISMQFLPFIFEPELISLFLFVYLLIGQLDRLGYFAELAPARNVGAPQHPRDAAGPAAVAWMPSR